jgi:hypothetical protein
MNIIAININTNFNIILITNSKNIAQYLKNPNPFTFYVALHLAVIFVNNAEEFVNHDVTNHILLFRTVCFAKSCYTKLPKISSEDKYFLKIL